VTHVYTEGTTGSTEAQRSKLDSMLLM